MIIHRNVTLGSAVYCTAVPLKMVLDPTFGTIASAGSGLLSSILGYKSQQQANKNYIQGVRETNALNERLFHENISANRVNAAVQNAYNSPASQLARLRSAGINDISSITGHPAASVQSVSPAAAQAPAQTPNPMDRVDLGGITRDAIAAYQSGQQIQSDNYNLYMKGIDQQYYIRQKLQDIRMKELDVLGKETQNASDFEQLGILQTQAAHLEKMLSQQEDINDETYNNLIKSGKKIDEDVNNNALITAATIKNMSAQQAIAWYNARTERQHANNEFKRDSDNAHNAIMNWLLAARKDRREQKEWKKHFDFMNEWELPYRSVVFQYALSHLKREDMNELLKSSSLLGSLWRFVFGSEPLGGSYDSILKTLMK